MIGRYTVSNDLELEADAVGLHVFAGNIRLSENAADLCLSVPDFAFVFPAPYTGFLTNVIVSHTDTQVDIQRSHTTLSIAGSKKFMAILADNIDYIATNADNHSNHIHVEYYPGIDYLHPFSLSLVVSVMLK